MHSQPLTMDFCRKNFVCKVFKNGGEEKIKWKINLIHNEKLKFKRSQEKKWIKIEKMKENPNKKKKNKGGDKYSYLLL